MAAAAGTASPASTCTGSSPVTASAALDAVEARSCGPGAIRGATEGKVRDFIFKTRLELTAAGWDAGPVTIDWHLERAGLHLPPASAIRRILHAAGLVTAEPRRRPRSSCRRFQADQLTTAGSPTSSTGCC